MLWAPALPLHAIDDCQELDRDKGREVLEYILAISSGQAALCDLMGFTTRSSPAEEKGRRCLSISWRFRRGKVPCVI